MANPNLTAALRASLEADKMSDQSNSSDSPLRLADENSVDILLDRINTHMAEGLPEKITDQDLMKIVDLYRSQAFKWEQDEAKKAEAGKGSRRRTIKEAVEGLEL